MNKGIWCHWRGKYLRTGFGNNLILAHLVKILIDNELQAAMGHHRAVSHLVDVPFYDPDIHINYYKYRGRIGNSTDIKNIDQPFIVQHIRKMEQFFEQRIYFDKEKHNHVPVLYNDLDHIPEVDVVLCTKSSKWGWIRDWPYFAELKVALGKHGLTFIDLNEKQVFGIECLNYVKKCKVYVGLDTGTSHYVSKFANGKGLIIQSGFSPFYLWSFPYDYKPIISNVHCTLRPCFLDREQRLAGRECEHDYVCIKSITVDMVMKEILGMC